MINLCEFEKVSQAILENYNHFVQLSKSENELEYLVIANDFSLSDSFLDRLSSTEPICTTTILMRDTCLKSWKNILTQ